MFSKPRWIQKLSELFSKDAGKQMLKHGLQPLPRTSEAMRADVAKILAYANEPAYEAWDKEAWAAAYTYLTKILNESSTLEEVNQARGSLRATLDLLRLADLARRKQDEMERKAKLNPATPRP